MKESIYFDTSALAKWYLNETRSDEKRTSWLRLIELWQPGPSCWGFPWFDLIDSAIYT